MPPYAPFRRLRNLANKQTRKSSNELLTDAQQYMYGSEMQMNFRTISKLCATRSNRTLTADDIVSAELDEELAEIGQFAEVVYPSLPHTVVFQNMELFSRTQFPLEGYDALQAAELVLSFEGKVAKEAGLICYRPQQRQLVVAFSGSATAIQAFYDLRFRRRRHPAGRGCAVHNGFWKIYKGVRDQVLEGMEQGLKEHDVKEVVLTGHSLGGAIASLLALELLTSEQAAHLPTGVTLKIVGFGSPRAGNAKLVAVWREAVRRRQEKEGEGSVQEYLVKAYNDGVPALPPASFGYRHFAAKPLYFYHGRLFHVPESENEHGIFAVAEDALDPSQLPGHPRGGHNYYNSRDLEKLHRRMFWIKEMMDKGPDWESQYIARVVKHEEDFFRKSGRREAAARE